MIEHQAVDAEVVEDPEARQLAKASSLQVRGRGGRTATSGLAAHAVSVEVVRSDGRFSIQATGNLLPSSATQLIPRTGSSREEVTR
jgi:hypothetical protein